MKKTESNPSLAGVTVSTIEVKDTSSPIVRFRYAVDTKVLTVWWKAGTNKPFPKPKIYLYLAVPSEVFERMAELNVPASKKEMAIKKGADVVPSLGTYMNTKVKKFPSINLSMTKVTDEVTVAKRTAKTVETKSKRDVKPEERPKVKKAPVQVKPEDDILTPLRPATPALVPRPTGPSATGRWGC